MAAKPHTSAALAVFASLKKILAKHSRRLAVHQDEATTYYVNTRKLDKKNRPVCFGAAALRKSYVSFYLMPVYMFPDLLTGISPALKDRMQGKSCFNFQRPDEEHFKELAALTKASLERFQKEGLA